MPFIQKHLPLAGSLKKTFKIRKTQIIFPTVSQVGVIYECNLVLYGPILTSIYVKFHFVSQ